MLVLYAVVFGSLALIRHWAFHSTALDLGVFDQVLWNTVHGRFSWSRRSASTGAISTLSSCRGLRRDRDRKRLSLLHRA